ncbi:MAG TPA: gliding motility-associated ABC transporter ATP-binding subunit GldA [Chitinophagales bacterium]|jgi:ABC-2 type transport system ATP-binding protein|nr:gliding motility-associated ABC transporter ATP-binding subunit GldA [Chitinophagales bacterium]MBP6154955.1 gliding motility-associated ABC transporter ATP-binding subunit GldA [Chitinophagales bacterium]HQV78379.1 gliding motility-associated ABC transporter ATP-binding subunit GldA [Chitinophagales bacterium]HQW79530.1 gliding motility-associated ABC transporter ATP-binding subunit GldA [Chitinophagales bacterium]HRB18625.1 gliding motility-associated ABC transporter ATP-binding subunit Gl
MSVSVQHLSKYYNTQKAVDDISFVVKKGEILGFLGPNGAGKSTTMKMLTCYLPPSSGSANLCGFDILKEPLAVKQKIGYLPENNPLYYDMYVKEFLEFALRISQPHLKSKSGSIIKETIDLVGLNVEQHKKIGQLSKGYKQRVGIAQALIHQPEVLILDEPTSGLDPNQLADIRQLIRNLGKERTIIFSTHIMQEVQAVCDKVVIINKGKIVANDTADNLQNRLKNEVCIEVEFENEIEEEELKIIQQLHAIEKISNNNFMLRGNNSKQLRKEIFEFAVHKKNSLLTLKEETQSLEDVFHQLTQSS